MLFALVASRALAPSSKLAATRWIADDVYIDGLAEVDADSCYRAMDFLLRPTPCSARNSIHPLMLLSLLHKRVTWIACCSASRRVDRGGSRDGFQLRQR